MTCVEIYLYLCHSTAAHMGRAYIAQSLFNNPDTLFFGSSLNPLHLFSSVTERIVENKCLRSFCIHSALQECQWMPKYLVWKYWLYSVDRSAVTHCHYCPVPGFHTLESENTPLRTHLERVTKQLSAQYPYYNECLQICKTELWQTVLHYEAWHNKEIYWS